jgi:hypothetical protein
MRREDGRTVMRVKSSLAWAVLVGAALSLSACSDQKADPGQQGAQAAQSRKDTPPAAGGDALATSKPGDEPPNKMEKLGSKTKDFAVATKDVTTDGLILAKIKAKFADDSSLKGCAFNVDIKDNIVTLKGFATSSAAKAKAETIAKETKGVNRVVNEVVVAKK